MEPYLRQGGHSLSGSRLYESDDILPDLSSLDWLIVMGGPMNIYDDVEYPWLAREREFIQAAIHAGKIVLGICLGAQLIADALGAKVVKNPHDEIGWFPVLPVAGAGDSEIGSAFQRPFTAFHWHGDTFHIPDRAIRLAGSEACENQAFAWQNRVFGFQFHLESTRRTVEDLLAHCGSGLAASRFVQTADVILREATRFEELETVMRAILGRIESIAR